MDWAAARLQAISLWVIDHEEDAAELLTASKIISEKICRQNSQNKSILETKQPSLRLYALEPS